GSNSPNPTEVYGVLRTPAAANEPSYREGSATWTDSNGDFWLCGGLGTDILIDLWEYKPAAPTAVPSFALSASTTSVNVAQGSSGSSTLSLNIGGGFNSAVALTASGQPGGV